jgi:hypothetical protein
MEMRSLTWNANLYVLFDMQTVIEITSLVFLFEPGTSISQLLWLGHRLDTWGIVFWFPSGTRNLPSHRNVQTGWGAHPGTYSMNNGVLTPDVKRPGRGANHLPPSRIDIRNEGSRHSISTYALNACTGITLPLLYLLIFESILYILSGFWNIIL